MQYRFLTQTHPCYQPEYWQELRALYAGGQDLLGNRETMRRIFPKHGAEEESTYRERLQRAVYVNYAGTVLDYIVASLCAEPITMTAEPDADPFFVEFVKEVDGHKLTFAALVRNQILTALQTRTSWTLIDLPPRDDGDALESETDEEEAGALRAYAIPLEPESVLDWDDGPSGELEWALVCVKSQPRKTLESDRSMITERYTLYTRTAWERWEVTYKNGKPPKPAQEIPSVKGSHSFGRVPLVRLSLPDGLWAMNKIHNLAKEHLNKRSSTSWSQYRHLFPILGAYLAPEMGAGGAIPAAEAQDPGRATNQVYGIGRIVVFGKDDELRYTSPDAGIYDSALRDLDSMRDEIFRVLHHMALAADNSSAALGRGGESKKQDRAAANVVLTALGELCREFAVEVFDLASRGRMDSPPRKWTAQGMQAFDTASLSDVVEESAIIDTLKIPSQTFQQIRIFAAAKRIVKGNASATELETIREELENNISAEEFAGTPAGPATPPQYAPVPPQEPDGDEPGTEQ
jgi:hypothetical protein